jgi:caffeoyl-CoA O-methyltransferase
MFTDLPKVVRRRMEHLEALDAADRAAGGSRMQRLRQVPPETGRFLALMAASAPRGNYLEIGTSGGYSTLWISLACRELDRTLTTIELDPTKVAIARATFHEAGVDDIVTLLEGDARDRIADHADISFCFLDAEKEVYADCYELIVPRMVRGGLLLADNAISHRDELEPMIERALRDDRVDALVVPIGKGELLCRKR